MKTFQDYGINTRGASGGNIKTMCPKCNGKNDLSVNITDGVWKCHKARCGWTGSLKPKERRVFDAVTTRAVAPEEPIYEFFRKRGISQSVVDRNRITQEVVKFGETPYKAVCFNFYAGDVITNIKYRRIAEKEFKQSYKGTPVFYKLNDLEGVTECIITEGEIDALSFEMAGFENAVSVPAGAINETDKNVETKMRFLDNSIEFFEGIERVYLALDTDAPGIRMRDELARRLGKRKCWIVNFPDGAKDANDVLMKFGGSSKLKECIEKAEPYPFEGVFDLTSRERMFDLVYEQGFPNGAETRFTGFNKLLKFYPGGFTVVTGIPGHGKSNFLDQLLMDLTILHGWKTALFTPENAPLENHLIRLSEMFIGKPFMPGTPGRMTKDELKKAKDFIRPNFFYINPETESFTLENVFDRAGWLVMAKGINALVIDPWNAIEHHIQRGENETAYVARALNKIRFFARNHSVHVFLVAHPTKIQKKGDGLYEIPTLYNISGSAHFYNIVDNGITVYRRYLTDDTGSVDYSRSLVEAHVQKVKQKYMGRTGMQSFEFDTACQSYTEIGEGKQVLDYTVPDADEPPPGFEWKSKPKYAGYDEAVGF